MSGDAPSRRSAVLAILTRAANAGEVCPSNNDIAASIGASSPSAPANWLARLEKDGVIEVARGSSARVVTIVSTGKRTAGEIGEIHWRLRDSAKAKAAAAKTRDRKLQTGTVHVSPSADDVPLTRVHRDPCFLCGARGDVGCRHHAAQAMGV